MKSMLKIFLVISLFSSITFAEGDMGNGGFTDEGDMGNGGRPCTQNCQTFDQSSKDSKDQETNNFVLDYVQDFISRIIG